MGLVVKVLNKYSVDEDVEKLIAYIAGKGSNEGTENVLSVHGHGISNRYKKAFEQMIKIQRLYKKDNGRRCYHMVVSFPQDMMDRNTIILAADAIAYMIFEEMHYQVFYGIHTSTDNPHIHFAISAVNYKTGKKWHKNKYEFAMFKKSVEELVNSVCESKK